MIKAKVQIIDVQTEEVLCDGMEVLPLVDTYTLKHGEVLVKSEFEFVFEWYLEEGKK